MQNKELNGMIEYNMLPHVCAIVDRDFKNNFMWLYLIMPITFLVNATNNFFSQLHLIYILFNPTIKTFEIF